MPVVFVSVMGNLRVRMQMVEESRYSVVKDGRPEARGATEYLDQPEVTLELPIANLLFSGVRLPLLNPWYTVISASP